MKPVSSLTALCLFTCYLPTVHSLELFNDQKSTLDLTGNLSVYYIKGDGKAEINDGFSRYTFDMSHQLKDGWQAIALLEWGLQLSSTNDQIYVSNHGLTSTGPTSETTWLRHGFVGVQHDTYGRFTMGKQWGVSYDVGGITDVFEVFGGRAQGTYNFGTDGGFSGTGLAEQAIQYKLNYQNFAFGVQYLVSDDVISTETDPEEDGGFGVKFDDSYGVSATYQAPYDISLGLAYNKAEVSLVTDINDIEIETPSLDDELISAHIKYRKFGDEGLHIALVLTDMANHEINDIGRVMNKSSGIELLTSYRFENNISLIGGYISLKDNSNTPLKNNDYHLNYYILSAKYHWDEDFYLFLESKIDDSTTVEQNSKTAENATSLGMMYVF